MEIYPIINFTLLNGFLLILPLLGLRFGLPALVRRESLTALDHFPPVAGRDLIVLKVYSVSNMFLIFSPLLVRIVTGTIWATVGWICYPTGVLVLGLALYHFSTAPQGKLIATGLYRFSRNPIYVGYFLIFVGVALLIGSWFHLALTLVYQISVHYLILSEEDWCKETYGQQYTEYQQKVRRYL